MAKYCERTKHVHKHSQVDSGRLGEQPDNAEPCSRHSEAFIHETCALTAYGMVRKAVQIDKSSTVTTIDNKVLPSIFGIMINIATLMRNILVKLFRGKILSTQTSIS